MAPEQAAFQGSSSVVQTGHTQEHLHIPHSISHEP